MLIIIFLRTAGIQKTYEKFDIKIQTSPMKKVLKQFLELSDTFSTIIQFINEKVNETGSMVTSMQQGTVWKNIKSQNPNKMISPLSLYADDYEINNP